VTDGTTTSRAQFIQQVKSGDLDSESQRLDDIQVRVHGDTAVVTFRSTDKGRYKDKDVSGQYRWMDTFVRRNGRWLLVASLGTPIKQPTDQ
jgi:ketosteroid isomerase-like protein